MDAKDAGMAVVDTFTRLILGDASELGTDDQVIIQALRLVDGELAGDSLQEMGAQLASLEVAEMIELVAKVRERLSEGVLPAGDVAGPAAEAPQPAR